MTLGLVYVGSCNEDVVQSIVLPRWNTLRQSLVNPWLASLPWSWSSLPWQAGNVGPFLFLFGGVLLSSKVVFAQLESSWSKPGLTILSYLGTLFYRDVY
jgi:hypothetical protein